MAKPVKATPEAKKLALEWVKNNPSHPAAIAYLRHASQGGTLSAIRARQIMEQGIGKKTK
jgi:hypothetical protein